jgi:hypothetical protein
VSEMSGPSSATVRVSVAILLNLLAHPGGP